MCQNFWHFFNDKNFKQMKQWAEARNDWPK
jgi:hypothetical protein